MVQVPYSPVPDVTPQVNPTGPVRIDTPLAAFGGAVAQATSHLGEVESHVGDELFARANALQELNQQADAAEKTSAYITKLGDLHADYTSKLGKDAVDGYQPFVTAVNQTREDFRKQLTSPVAQRAYDQESRTMMSRAIWSGSSHQAQQFHSYLNAASVARGDAADNYSAGAPDDEDSFQNTLKVKRDEANNQAQLNGWSDEVKTQKTLEATSESWSTRLYAMGRGTPQQAEKLLHQAVDANEITRQDANKVQDFLDRQNRGVGARMASTKFMSGEGGPGSGKVDILQARSAIGSVESKSYELEHPPVPDGLPRAGERALGRYGIMPKEMHAWLAESGQPDMTKDEFLHNHAAQDKLFDFKFGQYMEKYGSFYEAARHWLGTGPSGDGHMNSFQYAQKASAALNGGLRGTKLDDAAKDYAKNQFPDDPLAQEATVTHIRTEQYRIERQQRADEIDNLNIVNTALAPGDDGAVVTSLHDMFAKDPAAQKAYEAMTGPHQKHIQDIIEKNAKQGGYQVTPDNQNEYFRLMNIARDPEHTADEVDEFLQKATDPGNKMPNEYRTKLLAAAQALNKVGVAPVEPYLKTAHGLLAQQLDDAGIISNGKISDRDAYNRFFGELHDVLQDSQRDVKRKLSDDEIKEAGTRLLQTQIPGPTNFWGNPTKTNLWQAEPTEDFKAKIRQKWQAERGTIPSDDIVQSVYTASQYQALYGRKPKSKVGAQ